MTEQKRRSGLRIMGRLLGLVRPLLPVMFLAVLLGSAGYLCAVFLTVTAVSGFLKVLSGQPAGGVFPILVILAVMRGILHYGEQYCNHYIAFKLLAVIRNKVFAALRNLCPAKLEGRDKGNLISVITSDIELLEVFYAHTISPVFIAAAVSSVMVLWIGSFDPGAGILAAAGYLTVGAVIPLYYGKRGGDKGMEFRNGFGNLNSFLLDSLRGLGETIQYQRGEHRRKEMEKHSLELGGMQRKLNHLEASQRSITNLTILLYSAILFFMMLYLQQKGQSSYEEMMMASVAMMGSFGPVTALASLANHLNQTLASAERVLSLLEEEPETEETAGEKRTGFSGASAEHVWFAYDREEILKDCTMEIPEGEIVGIHGPSGCGKSTLLKLIMRFWDTDDGAIRISGRKIEKINTVDLRRMEAYVTQETSLFHDSIANNIAVGRPGASRQEIEAAAKKASLHDFICSLPEGYDTGVGELGETLSGGERQRIGIARAFLHDAPFLLLDEPTSNLDVLNEGMILKSLMKEKEDRTILLVSHRQSTMKVADRIFQMAGHRKS